MLFSKENRLKWIKNSFFTAIFCSLIVSFFFAGCFRGSHSSEGGVISLSPNTSEVIGVFFPNINLVGCTNACNYPKFIKGVESVCNIKPNIERIHYLRPKKIFLDEQLFQKREVEELKKIASVFNFRSNNLCSYIESLRAMQVEFGRSELLERYIHRLESFFYVEGKGRVVVLLDGGPRSNYYIVGRDSFLGDVLRKSGFKLIGPRVKDFKPIGIEELLSYRFDVILTGCRSSFIEKDLRLRRYRLFKVDDDLLFRAGARVYELMLSLQDRVY